MTWKKGESGYTGGKKPHKALTHALIMRVTDDPKQAHRVARKLWMMAEDGDINAAKLIFERLEGKADQNLSIEHSGSVEHNHNLTTEERRERVKELMAKTLIATDVVDVEATPVPRRRLIVEGE